MISRLVAAAVAVTALTMPAQAYTVSYNTQTVSLDYAQNVARMYDVAPAALRARVGSPVVYVTDISSFKRMPFNSKQAFAKDTFFLGQAIRNKGSNVGRLVFIAKNMQQIEAEAQLRVVLHEMVHLYDFERAVDKSAAPGFVAAFRKDVEYVKDVLRKTAGDAGNAEIALAYAHYFDAPKEAFAEAGARLLSPPTNYNERSNFFRMFRNTTEYVYDLFVREGFVNRSLAEIVQSKETQLVAEPPLPSELRSVVKLGADGRCPQGSSLDPVQRTYCLKNVDVTEMVTPAPKKQDRHPQEQGTPPELKAENDARIQLEIEKARAQNIVDAKEYEARIVRLGSDGSCPTGSSLEPLQGTYCLKDYDQKRAEKKARAAVFAE